MIRCLAFGVSVLAASPAFGLSCAPIEPTARFANAVAAPEGYVVLHGRLSFDPALMSPGGSKTVPVPATPFVATFTGDGLKADGFAPIAPSPIVIRQGCAASWCGTVTPGQVALFFAQQVGADWVLDAGPCPTNVMTDVDASDLRDIEVCLRNGAC